MHKFNSCFTTLPLLRLDYLGATAELVYMCLSSKEQIDVLLHEHQHLIERDQRLTTFYHRFSTIGVTFVGVVVYYATQRPAMYHALPFLIPLLLLFLEYWRMDTVATNAYLARIELRINNLAGQKLLVYKQIVPRPGFFFVHSPTETKILNPMFVLSAIMTVAFVAIIAVSYAKVYEYFTVNECWSGWIIVYCATSGLLLLYAGTVVFILESRRKIYSFWDRVADSEYPNPSGPGS